MDITIVPKSLMTLEYLHRQIKKAIDISIEALNNINKDKKRLTPLGYTFKVPNDYKSIEMGTKIHLAFTKDDLVKTMPELHNAACRKIGIQPYYGRTSDSMPLPYSLLEHDLT